ncbi:uncharacterized protein LOC111863405 isoform X3 [Cryptotermes secundus]|uniref:uncharacterized protein LOC111863405 isoform X3 n=1 Tax=Cryptotermes secundus TaxID=105785 RepID=UPI000CD7B0FD|nr:uncharacterized protein LOC111863405 isoform X3 [Cryptotermes secundus]
MAVCCQGQTGEEWVIILKYGRRLEKSWECSFYFECDLKLLVKATGVILLLGVGSLVCYKICNHYWPRPRPRPRPCPKDTLMIIQPQNCEDQLLEDLEDTELSETEGRYFGPSPVPRDGDFQAVNSSFPCSRSASGSTYPNSSTSHSDSGTSGEEEGRDADVSDGSQGEKSPKHLHVLQQQQKYHLRCSRNSSLQPRFRPLGSRRLGSSSRRFARQPLDNKSGWLTDRISKILTSTPDRLQLSESAWLNLPSSQSPTIRLSCAEARRLGSEFQLDLRENFRLTGPKRLSPEGAETEWQQGDPDGDSNGTQNLQFGTSLIRDESYDSLGFSKRLPRDGSFDSTFSDLSLDFLRDSFADVDNGTMLCMEKLQQEIDQLKTNCQVMDEEFEMIKCNRNLPGMSSLMKAKASNSSLASSALESNLDTDAGHQEFSKQEKARVCFAGLYSLTTIKNSTSSEISDYFPAPVLDVHSRGSIDSAESLEWDSPKIAASPAKKSQERNVSSSAKYTLGHSVLEDGSPLAERKLSRSQNSEKSILAPTPSEDELMASLEWDEEDLKEYPEIEEGGITVVTVNTLERDTVAELSPTVCNLSEESQSISSNLSFAASPNTERYKMESSSGFENGSKMFDSYTSQMASDMETKARTCWSSEESGCMEWDTAVMAVTECGESDQNFIHQCWDETTVSAQSSSNPSELSTPGSENLQSLSAFVAPAALENIGPRVVVSQYAAQEWQGNTKKAITILQGYSKIPSLFGLQHLRRIRGDNYCGVRAAIFQTLAQGLNVPSGEKTFHYLSNAISNEDCRWLQDWTFAGRLPYHGNNVLHGMAVCLQNLDNVASLLSSTNGDREETLATLLNSDPTLDLHVVEAVKLHMLQCAMELYQGHSSGSDNMPLFASLMFARDTSETPKHLMNNHLCDIGNSGGLEQDWEKVEMFLLGYMLGVTLRVIRPVAFGTEDFICSYPDWNEGNWPKVFLIAEDDRHYNVLVE